MDEGQQFRVEDYDPKKHGELGQDFERFLWKHNIPARERYGPQAHAVCPECLTGGGYVPHIPPTRDCQRRGKIHCTCDYCY